MSIQSDESRKGKGKRPPPPPGIKTDYDQVFAIGYHGPIDEKLAREILQAELDFRFVERDKAIHKSWELISEGGIANKFLTAFVAVREIMEIYPITRANLHSGERIPLYHAGEVTVDATLLAFQGLYKSSYQSLRELLEMVLLQLYFYEQKDKSMVGKWWSEPMKLDTIG